MTSSPAALFGGSLHLIEDLGLRGSWRWTFGDDAQTWSPGLYRMLGLTPDDPAPRYDRLRAMAHPEDRDRLATPAQVRDGDLRAEHSFRIVRPDGTVRLLAARHEVERAPDGRPRAVAGDLVSALERHRLAGIIEAESRLHAALHARTGVLFFRVGQDLSFAFQPEAELVSGVPLAEFNADPFVHALPGERARLLGKAAEYRVSGRIFRDTNLWRRPDGQAGRVGILVVPFRNAAGAVDGGQGLQYPIPDTHFQLPAGIREALEEAVVGSHLRAARALLDWSMTVLAEASGVSLSTVRRLEEDGGLHGERSRRRVVAALRRAGIRFTLLEDGVIAVSRH
ncbi:PAS domain-containing protein [Methylobacterium hispanicum]|uniref:PAS domain-containing protein n=1 Tax=Methylobacterium hispanicum TaxID=270350 RepID=UPI002F33355A